MADHASKRRSVVLASHLAHDGAGARGASAGDSPPPPAPLTENRVLGDQSVRPEVRKHRVAMGGWYLKRAGNDPRINSADQLFSYCRRMGYDGIEFGVAGFKDKYFPAAELEGAATAARAAAERHGMRIFGSLYHVQDYVWKDEPAYLAQLRRELRADAMAGAEYVDYQVYLSEQYMGTGGDYTDDASYIRECTRRVDVLRRETHQAGLNFYLETHIDRITEDPRALCMILDQAERAFEINGDLSHYVMKGIRAGKTLDRVYANMGHCHVRLARTYGDLSANVDDPAADWDEMGLTWLAFNFHKKGFRGGLSSRTIVEEAGPMHLVTDPLSVGAKLVPLLRAMATWCDNEAQCVPNPVLASPQDLRPFDAK